MHASPRSAQNNCLHKDGWAHTKAVSTLTFLFDAFHACPRVALSSNRSSTDSRLSLPCMSCKVSIQEAPHAAFSFHNASERPFACLLVRARSLSLSCCVNDLKEAPLADLIQEVVGTHVPTHPHLTPRPASLAYRGMMGRGQLQSRSYVQR